MNFETWKNKQKKIYIENLLKMSKSSVPIIFSII